MFSKSISRRFEMGSRGARGLAVALATLGIVIGILPPAHAAQLTLTWTDSSTNEDGFKVERKTGSDGAYGQLTSLVAETTGYVDATVTTGTTYCYRVRAYNSAGDSAYSNEACAAPASATPYAVGVTKMGTGSGTVTSAPSGITCGTACSTTSADFSYGTNLTLTATPATGSSFTSWSGAGCSGTGTCTFPVSAATTVTATFTLNSYTLTLSKAGTGSGTVTSNPSGVNCGSDCAEDYSYNTSVALTAAVGTGSTFTGWSGGGCSGTGTCTVTMTTARTVTATFALSPYSLTVTKAGTGTGTVTSTPSGVNCGTDCAEDYPYNTSVTLTAAPTDGATFSGWSGACSGTGACAVNMTTAQSVTATFANPTVTTYQLAVTRTGAGTISSTPAGIDCGSTCSASFAAGSTVDLAATPPAGFTFTGWGGACSGTGACTVNMTAERNVTATFATTTHALNVTKAGTGAGTVTSSPSGIACGSNCAATFNYGTSVTLATTPAAGSTFAGWGGACTGTGSCTVTMTAAQGVTATFAAAATPLTVTTVTADKTGSQPIGTAITFTATVTGGTAPQQCKWFVTTDPTWASYTVLQPWQGCTTTVPWTPTVAGGYQVGVWARSSGTAADLPQATKGLAFTITPRQTTVRLSANQASPKTVGTPVTFTATASTGTAPYTYKWWVTTDNWRTWSLLRDWGGNTYTWTPATPGPYQVGVWARSSGNSADYPESGAGHAFTVTPLPVTVTATPTSPRRVGATVTLTATVTGGTAPQQCKWFVTTDPTWASYTVLQPWQGCTTTVPWTPTVPGSYQVGVWARSSGTSADAPQGSAGRAFTVTPLPVTVTATPTSPRRVGTTVTLTATVTGGTAPQQCKWFVTTDPTWASYTVSRDWHACTTAVSWTPTVPGNYQLGVWARSSGTSADVPQGSAGRAFTVTASTPSSVVGQ